MSSCNCTVSLPGPSLANACGGGAFVIFMGLLETFLRSQCDIEDPCRQIRSQEQPDDEYDFIVLGGGSTGAVVAGRLSEVSDWKVLVVEAGGNEPTGSQVPSLWTNYFGSSINWGFVTEPEEGACLGKKEHRCTWPRGKVIGGTGVIHGMMYMRGSKTDFNNWAADGNTGWAYEDVLPYFLKSENNLQAEEMDEGFHAKGGPMPVSRFPYQPPITKAILKAAEELGYSVGDRNGKTHEGFMVAQTNSMNGVRFSSSHAFLRPAHDRANLHIMLKTTAARVLVDDKTKTAVGVEIIKSDGTKQTIKVKKEVIVCGGAVNSPQILLLSGIGPKEDLEKVNVTVVHDLQGVGKNLHNHVSFRLAFSINETATYDLDWAAAVKYLLFRNGPMSSTGLSQLTGLVKSKFANASEDHPDIQLFFGGYSASCAKTGTVGEVSEVSPGIVGKLMGTPAKRIITISPTVLQPKSRGYLTLADNNPLSHPKIFPKYLSDDHDLKSLLEGIKIALKLFQAKSLQEYCLELNKTPAKGCERKEFGSDEYWECAVRVDTLPENHQAGSCKMGPSSDPLAVVDPHLLVHGLTNLRVADASIMPTLTAGNTHAVCVMIGEKAADMITKKWSHTPK